MPRPDDEPTCDDCGASPTYYTDDTNDHYYCRPCWGWHRDGKADNVTTQPTNLPALEPAQEQARVAQGHATDLLKYITTVKVTTAEQEQWASGVGRQLAEQRKGLEAERDAVAKPIYAAYKRVRSWFKPPIETLDTAIAHLKTEIGAYRRSVEEQARAQLAEATTPAEVEQATAAVVAPKPSTHTEVRHYAAKIVDVSKIPASYWTHPDVIEALQRVLDREARERKETFDVPGCELVVDKRVRWT